MRVEQPGIMGIVEAVRKQHQYETGRTLSFYDAILMIDRELNDKGLSLIEEMIREAIEGSTTNV